MFEGEKEPNWFLVVICGILIAIIMLMAANYLEKSINETKPSILTEEIK